MKKSKKLVQEHLKLEKITLENNLKLEQEKSKFADMFFGYYEDVRKNYINVERIGKKLIFVLTRR